MNDWSLRLLISKLHLNKRVIQACIRYFVNCLHFIKSLWISNCALSMYLSLTWIDLKCSCLTRHVCSFNSYDKQLRCLVISFNKFVIDFNTIIHLKYSNIVYKLSVLVYVNKTSIHWAFKSTTIISCFTALNLTADNLHLKLCFVIEIRISVVLCISV